MLIYTIAWEHTNIHVCTWALTHKHLYINTHAHAILHVTKQTTKEFSLSIEKAPTSVSTRIKKVHLNSINCNPSSTKPSSGFNSTQWSRSSITQMDWLDKPFTMQTILHLEVCYHRLGAKINCIKLHFSHKSLLL